MTWYVYLCPRPRGLRAFPRELSPGERKKGELLVAVHRDVSRKTAIARTRADVDGRTAATA